MTRLTPAQKELADDVLRLSGDVDRARHELGQRALRARRERVPDYLAIIGTACRRAESTVSHWARTQEWIEEASHTAREWVGTSNLPYSFFEHAARYSDRLSNTELCEALWTWHEESGATLETFRAHLAGLAGAEAGDVAEIRRYLERTSSGLRRKANDFGLAARVRDGMLLAADTLDDAVGEGERVTA